MPTNRFGIVLVSLLIAGCASPRSMADRTGDSAFEDARLPSTAESIKLAAGSAVEEPESSLAAWKHEAASICAPSPSQNREKSNSAAAQFADELRLAQADVEAGRIDEARSRYEQVLAKCSGNADAHHGLAVIADNARDFTTAHKHYQAALLERPTDAGLLSDLGYSYLLQGKFDESVEVLNRATQLAPSNRQALNNLGLAFALKKDPEHAFEAFRKADGDEAARARIAQLFPDQPPQTAAPDAGPVSNPQIVPRTLPAGGSLAPFDSTGTIVNASTDVLPPPFSNDSATPAPIATTEETPLADWPGHTQNAATPQPAPAQSANVAPLTDRQTALLGMNAGACGPFPMFYEPAEPTAPTAAIAAADQALNSDPAGAQLAQTSASPIDATTAPATYPPVGSPVTAPATTPTNDPLANFEAEMRRRAAEDYSSQRSFRTGSTRASARPIVPPQTANR